MRATVDRVRRLAGRRTLLVLGAAVGLVLLARPAAGASSDLFQNIGPASQLPQGALSDRYPLGRYQLDHHFAAVKAGVLSGIDVSGIPPTIAWFLANTLWQLTAFLAHLTITLFTFAFSLDLVNGSQATGGAGALEPVSRAVASIYETTFGEPWMVVAILLAGLWAIYQALVRRRYTETAGSLALSLVLVLIALAFVTQPQRTIGSASQWSNAMSGAFLSLTSKGTVSDPQQAKQNAADQLFALLVYQPWTVLQFGGLEHCVKTPVDEDDPQSVAVRPLSSDPGRDAQLTERLRRTGQVQADGKACVHNERKYSSHFLAFSGDDRDDQYEALKDGDTGKVPDADPGKRYGSYRLSALDKPAAEAMGKDGQYERLLLALVLFVGELGAFLLLGALSIGVILAQVLVLLLVAFAPVALVIAVFPGRGHEFFLGWLTHLAGFLLRKAVYSLILAVLLAVAAAVGDASANLGWLMAFGLQATFFWAVFLYRNQLTGHLTLATTGHRAGDDGTAKLLGLYAAARVLKRLGPHRQPPPPPGERAHRPPDAPGPDPAPPGPAPGQAPGPNDPSATTGSPGTPTDTTRAAGPSRPSQPDRENVGHPDLRPGRRSGTGGGPATGRDERSRRGDRQADRPQPDRFGESGHDRPGDPGRDGRGPSGPTRPAAASGPTHPDRPIDAAAGPDPAVDRPTADAASSRDLPTQAARSAEDRGEDHQTTSGRQAASTPLLRDLADDARRLQPSTTTGRARRQSSSASDDRPTSSTSPSVAAVARRAGHETSTREGAPSSDPYGDAPVTDPPSEERS